MMKMTSLLALAATAAAGSLNAAIAQAPATAPPSPSGSAAAAPRPPMAVPGYVLGPNDEIQVTVFGQSDMSVATRIKEDGTINLPLLGSIRAAGRTASQLGADIGQAYVAGGYLSTASVNVEISSFVSQAATVLGGVANPANYPLDRSYTVAMLIARAGGVRTDGANVVVLTHANQASSERISLTDAQAALTVVRPGDTLFVPPAELVFVYGQVNQPGAFSYQPGMTFRQAMARAGGPTLAGSTRKFEVRRGGKILQGLKLDDTIDPQDVLIIKEKLF